MHAHEAPHDPHAAPEAMDPIHDIAERKTVLWLFIWGIGLLIGIAVMTELYLYMAFNERLAKSNVKYPFEENAHAAQLAELAGTAGGRSITQAMEAYLAR